jgi:hypothetical protein
MIHGLNDNRRLFRGREIRECEAAEDAVVEVVVEGVGEGEVHLGHDFGELLALDREGDVLDDDGGWDELFAVVIG